MGTKTNSPSKGVIVDCYLVGGKAWVSRRGYVMVRGSTRIGDKRRCIYHYCNEHWICAAVTLIALSWSLAPPARSCDLSRRAAREEEWLPCCSNHGCDWPLGRKYTPLVREDPLTHLRSSDLLETCGLSPTLPSSTVSKQILQTFAVFASV